MKRQDIALRSLLGEDTNIRDDVLHLPVGELSSPGMHRAEDDAMFNSLEQLVIRFQKRLKAVEISRLHFK